MKLGVQCQNPTSKNADVNAKDGYGHTALSVDKAILRFCQSFTSNSK